MHLSSRSCTCFSQTNDSNLYHTIGGLFGQLLDRVWPTNDHCFQLQPHLVGIQDWIRRSHCWLLDGLGKDLPTDQQRTIQTPNRVTESGQWSVGGCRIQQLLSGQWSGKLYHPRVRLRPGRIRWRHELPQWKHQEDTEWDDVHDVWSR